MNTPSHASLTAEATHAAHPVARIQQCEIRLARLITYLVDETLVREVAEVLHDLTAARLTIEAPAHNDKRSAARFWQAAVVLLSTPHGPPIEAALCDISVGGALVEAEVALRPGDRCRFFTSGMADDMEAVVAQNSDGRLRLVFTQEDSALTLDFLKHIDRHLMRY
jgi:hypothetical protein